MWVKRVAVVSAIVLLGVPATACGLLCGSRGSNVPSSLEAPVVAVAVPRDMSHGRRANWSAAWESGNSPYTIEWDFGGGAENIGPLAASSPDHQSPLMINEDPGQPATYSYTVSVQDSAGEVGYASGLYEVAPYLNTAPELSLSLDGRLLTATVHDPDGDDVLVSLSASTGLTGEPQSVTIPGGDGTAEFYLSGGNLFEAAAGTVTVTAADGRGGETAESIEVDIPAIVLADDTIYVIPLRNRVRVGGEVRFICATGTLAHPFRYLNSVSVVIEEDGEYVPGSFNVGTPGGAMDGADGIWPNVGVESFVLSEELIVGVAAGSEFSIPAGRRRWQFNVTGLGGGDLAGGKGVLFNFAMTFSKPGEKRVGLQQFDVVKRTYYSDGASTEYYWSGLMADEGGNLHVTDVDNVIVVE